jgi:hypothetical protein
MVDDLSISTELPAIVADPIMAIMAPAPRPAGFSIAVAVIAGLAPVRPDHYRNIRDQQDRRLLGAPGIADRDAPPSGGGASATGFGLIPA